jgi:glycosyltransferase involved in cell wall biosynthesis
MSHRIVVLVPAYNEEASIGRTIADLKLNVPTFDVVVVNDGSKDRTADVARQMGVIVIDLPFNLGIGGSVQTGFKYALRKGYDIVVQVDGDGQHDARSIYGLVAPLLDGKADIVVGSRYLGHYPLKMSLVRQIGIHYFSWLTTQLIGQKITDCSSGFRTINKLALVFFCEEYPIDFPDAEALILAHKAGLRIAEVPAKFRHRVKGKSSLRAFKLLYYPIKETFSILVIITKRGRD